MWDQTGATVPIPPGGARVPYQNKKFLAKSDALSVGDVPYMRAAEMYLIEAEARARQGQDVAARSALFTLAKNRNFNYLLSTNSGQALIDEIFFHRRIELWGEGKSYLALKRNKETLTRGPNHLFFAGESFTYDSDELTFPIPQAEVLNNPVLNE